MVYKQFLGDDEELNKLIQELEIKRNNISTEISSLKSILRIRKHSLNKEPKPRGRPKKILVTNEIKND